MRIHCFPATCDVCGGEGMGTIRTAGAAWDQNREVQHTNPRVCADNLARRARSLQRREEALSAPPEENGEAT